MKYKLLLLLCFVTVAFLTNTEVSAMQKKKEKAKTPVKKESDYDKLFKKDHVQAKGLITLHRVGDKLYFELPLNLLGKDMLIGSTVTEISDNGDAIVGQKPTEPINVQFTKIDSTIQLRKIEINSITNDKDQNIAAAIKQGSIGAIVGLYKIEAWNADSTAVVFDMTKFFVGDNKDLEPIDPYGANTYGGLMNRNSRFQSDKSFLGEIKSFKDNIIVRSHLSYECDIQYGRDYYEYKKPLTVVATRSIILLPENPARPRVGDPRVGIFPTWKLKFSNDDNRAENKFYANRWRIEPADEAAFKSGKLVEPKQPIIFYVDNNFPEMWKKYIMKGVEDWNLTFEKIGFKNVVQARPFPTNDPEFDPDNIKYSCIRYAPTWMANAMGPSWTDPRTGEIINASIYVYHNIVSLLYNWRFVHTAAVDPDVRDQILPEEIMGEAFRYVIRHEVGHCLGFMHNMAGSSSIPVDSLRSPSFTQKHGTTYSIMDYARNNYVAQPGDKEKGVRLTPQTFGEFDYYLVKWNYSYLPETKTPEEESGVLEKWVSDVAGNPIYRYGKQQIYLHYDPSSLTEDLGDDAMKASEYGIKNLKYILPNLNNWFDSSDKDYSHRATLYNEIVQQYVRYLNHVYTNIGGIYLNERYAGDPRPSYEVVSKEKQQRALKFMMDQVRNVEWLEDKNLLTNFSLIGSPAYDLQAEIVDRVMGAVSKLSLSVAKADKDPYTPESCLNEIYNYIWTNTIKGKKIDATDRRLQDAFVTSLISKATGTGSSGGMMIGITDQFKNIQAPEYIREKSRKDYGPETLEFTGSAPLGNGEISGFNYLYAINYTSAPSTAHIYHAVLMKTKTLLENNRNNASVETQNHYQLLLRRIEKALK